MKHSASERWEVGNGLAGYCWPAVRPRAVLLLQHGYAEYAERFVREHGALIPHLLDEGISVFAFDLEGHGRSPGTRGVVDIEEAVRRHLAARTSLDIAGLLLILLGHSLGGLITAASVVASSDRVKGVILSSPAFDRRSPSLRLMAERVAKMSPEWGIAAQQDPSGLSRDKEAVERFKSDPLIYRGPLPALMAASALRMANRVYNQASQWTVPTLIVHGSDDVFTPHTDSLAIFERLRSRDKTISVVPEGKHELFNDIIGSEMKANVFRRIDERLPWRASSA